MANVIFTKPRQERRAEAHLRQQGVEVLLPLCRPPGSLEVAPLFPRYLFAWLTSSMEVMPIWNTPGVSRVVGFSTDMKAAAVPDGVVEGIRERMRRDGGAVILEGLKGGRRNFSAGERIEINGGAYAGLRGVYVGRAGDRVRALLTMFGRTVTATVAEENVG